jgi:long-chain acyl-CoA synthetase
VSATNLGDVRGPDPGAIAIIDTRVWSGPVTRTHGELDREAAAVAAALAERGFPRGTSIGILAENRSEYVTAFLGILRAGLTVVPINSKFPPATVAHILADAVVQLTFCDDPRRALLPPEAAVISFDGASEDGFASFTAGPMASEPVAVAPGDIAMILYTSGSTGLPKGVPLTHRSHRWILDNRVAAAAGTAPSRVLIVAPLSHMNALGMIQFVLGSGASAVMMPRFETLRFIEAAAHFKVEILSTVPAMMALVLRERDALRAADLRSVKTVRMGSAPIADKLWDDVARAFPNATLRNGYGTTEAGPGVFGPGPQRQPVPRGACGWPQPGFEVRLVEDGHDADEGSLWMRSPANAAEYLHLPEQTRRAFSADGWYISGDRFRRDDAGAYWFVGRNDDMFVCGGENVYPGEVEAVIDRHPDVAESAVVPVPDDIKGEKPFAFVVRRADTSVDEDAIRQFVLANAPAYQHPRMVAFLDALPMSGPGKVDRAGLTALARRLWSDRFTPAS